MVVTAIFTYRRTSIITKRALEQELATKARHLMKRASVGLDGRYPDRMAADARPTTTIVLDDVE